MSETVIYPALLQLVGVAGDLDLDGLEGLELGGYRADVAGSLPLAELHPLRTLCLLPAEEAEHPLGEECGGVRVVGRQ
jgi:hypothetical protein